MSFLVTSPLSSRNKLSCTQTHSCSSHLHSLNPSLTLSLHPLIYFWICALQGLPEGQKVEQISVKKPTLNTFHKPQQKAKERNILQGQLNFIFASASWMALAERCKITAAKEIIHSPTWTPHRASAATNCCSSTCWPNPSTDLFLQERLRWHFIPWQNHHVMQSYARAPTAVENQSFVSQELMPLAMWALLSFSMFY